MRHGTPTWKILRRYLKPTKHQQTSDSKPPGKPLPERRGDTTVRVSLVGVTSELPQNQTSGMIQQSRRFAGLGPAPCSAGAAPELREQGEKRHFSEKRQQGAAIPKTASEAENTPQVSADALRIPPDPGKEGGSPRQSSGTLTTLTLHICCLQSTGSTYIQPEMPWGWFT